MSKIPFVPYLFLILLVCSIYYKFLILGKIPFPGDLLVGSYSPWFDYYKIPVQNPLISDVFSQFFLWKYLSIDSFSRSQWPLWNPYSFMGTPLLATYHSSTLYPLNLLILIPKYVGWGVFILSQTLISFVTMYLLLFYWTRVRLSSFLGAVIFGLSGLMATWLELGTAVHAMAWLPLCIYSVELFLEKEKLRYILFLIISFSLIVLAGNAQVTAYSLIIVSAYSVVQSWSRRISKLPYLFLAGILALLLCAIQLIPSFDLLQKSIRLTESYTAESNFGLLKLKDGLRFFIADFFGNPVTRNFWGNLNYSETSGFVGTLTLPLILYAYLFLKRTRINSFFLTLLPITLILAFNNPISNSLYQLKIPLLTSSYASRILFVTIFSVSILCAFSLKQILRDYQNLRKFFKTTIWSWAVVSGIIIGTVISYFLTWDIVNLEVNEKYLEFYLKEHEYSLNNFIIALRNSLLPYSLISFLLMFHILVRRVRISMKSSATYVCFLLFILLILDLGRYFLKFNPFVAQELIFPTPPALEFLKKQPGLFRVGREHAETFPPNTWIAYNLQSYEGYDPIYLNQYGKFIHFLNGGDLRTGNTNRYAELSVTYDSPFLDIGNVKYFIGIGRDRNAVIPGEFIHHLFNKAGYKKIYQDGSSIIVENPNVFKRAYFAPAIITLPESKIMDLMMEDKNFDPRKIIALSEDLEITSVTGQGSIEVSLYSPNLVKLSTETPGNEVLILADQYDEGWVAKIDGQITKISPANLIFRAVKIPAGSHEIIFEYWPKSFELGIKISLVTILSISLCSFALAKLKKF